MEKDPRTCKNSVCFDGIYICKLELLPCARCKKCAVAQMEDMAKAASSYIHRRKAKPKDGAQMEDENDGE